ncbi:DUF1501 domain-containing protein [Planctomicrobium sp. SH661]|uniref:DUF1501 domain-containing protein n=1 Tax=Planctomicrobium sp. SH661 TaxID=3448124 RepID=UPI003F5B819F
MRQRSEQEAGCKCHSGNRRAFLSDMGLGLTGMVLGSMLATDGHAKEAEPQLLGQHLPPKAKSVIWIFLSGGYSHVETFDPKPALNQFAGKTFDETTFENPVKSPLHAKRFRSVTAEEVSVREVYPSIYPMQVGWKKHGESGIEVTDWWPNLSRHVDDICFIRNMWTTDNDHAAENQIHTGRHRLDEQQPSIGAWAHYGLGTLNENLPKFAVLGLPTASVTRQSIDGYYLGPQHAGVPLQLDPKNPLPFGTRQTSQSLEQQRLEYELIHKLNGLAAVEYPEDQQLQARIKSYELAFRMQSAVPEAVDLAQETQETRALYGLDQPATKLVGERFLAARRLVERGVRFVQVTTNSYGAWDAHSNLKKNHTDLCATVDLPTAGLIQDLKQRGLLEDTVVVFCTEFGRTPGQEARGGTTEGRDHHPNGFTIWMAGAGLKKGYVHGETDELGYHALGEGHYVTDLHATVLHLLGLDSRKLIYPGRTRLEIDYGEVIHDVLA